MGWKPEGWLGCSILGAGPDYPDMIQSLKYFRFVIKKTSQNNIPGFRLDPGMHWPRKGFSELGSAGSCLGLNPHEGWIFGDNLGFKRDQQCHFKVKFWKRSYCGLVACCFFFSQSDWLIIFKFKNHLPSARPQKARTQCYGARAARPGAKKTASHWYTKIYA